jgi:hypothetical protein
LLIAVSVSASSARRAKPVAKAACSLATKAGMPRRYSGPPRCGGWIATFQAIDAGTNRSLTEMSQLPVPRNPSTCQ